MAAHWAPTHGYVDVGCVRVGVDDCAAFQVKAGAAPFLERKSHGSCGEGNIALLEVPAADSVHGRTAAQPRRRARGDLSRVPCRCAGSVRRLRGALLMAFVRDMSLDLTKPARGSRLVESRVRRRDRKAAEDKEMDAAKRRDGRPAATRPARCGRASSPSMPAMSGIVEWAGTRPGSARRRLGSCPFVDGATGCMTLARSRFIH